jgi:hypothetical protein
MRAGDMPSTATPLLLFGTVSGTLGVLATLDDENFAVLDKLQAEMGKLPSVGNLSNQEYSIHFILDTGRLLMIDQKAKVLDLLMAILWKGLVTCHLNTKLLLPKVWDQLSKN